MTRIFIVVEAAGVKSANDWFSSRGFGDDTFTRELYDKTSGQLTHYCAEIGVEESDRSAIRGAFGSGRRQNFDKSWPGHGKRQGEQTRTEILDGGNLEMRRQINL